MLLTSSSILALATTALAGGEHVHNHLTVDTTSGQPGDAISIVAGFYPTETDFTIDPDGTLLFQGLPAEYHMEEQLSEPGHEGWFAADSLILTSDYFFATGRLDGGNFAFEITNVTPVRGSVTAPRVAWADFEEGVLTFTADSAGATRLDRSFIVGVGGHNHGEVFAVSEPGEYDVTLIAWDLAGRYADSDPVTFHIHAAPPPCAGDFNADGAINTLDLVQLLGRFGQAATVGEAVDMNQDGTINTLDLVQFLGLFGQPC